ncbi:MAG: agmatinase [Chloroflexota bacterium]|nr:agmatinase [Chloroflexota bacterium]
MAILGVPLDLTESYRPGTAAGPAAIRAISDSLETYSPALDRDLDALALADLGDLPLDGLGMDAALAAIAEQVGTIAAAGALPVLLGGEHTLTLGAVRGLLPRYPDLHLLAVDAHLDLIDRYAGESVCHATVLRRICDEIGPRRVAQVGGRSGTAPEWRYAQELLHASPELSLPAGARGVLERVPIYLTIDIDVLDPSAAPGTGCPEPGGPSFRELHRFLLSLRGLTVVALDVVEVLPAIDPAGIAAVAAAKLVRESILLFAQHDA